MPRSDGPTELVARMRLVRSACGRIFLKNGYLKLHASAAVQDGNALLFVGDKGAGKTTIMLRLLETGSCDFMTNDELFYSASRGVFAGLPAALRIKRCTLSRYPWLAQHMEGDHPLPDRDNETPGPSNDRMDPMDVVGTVRPRDVCSMVGVAMSPTAPATSAVAYLLSSSATPVPTTAELLDSASQLRLLVPHIQSLASENQPMWNDGIHVDQTVNLRTMAESVPMRSLTYHHESLPIDQSLLG